MAYLDGSKYTYTRVVNRVSSCAIKLLSGVIESWTSLRKLRRTSFRRGKIAYPLKGSRTATKETHTALSETSQFVEINHPKRAEISCPKETTTALVCSVYMTYKTSGTSGSHYKYF